MLHYNLGTYKRLKPVKFTECMFYCRVLKKKCSTNKFDLHEKQAVGHHVPDHTVSFRPSMAMYEVPLEGIISVVSL